MQKYPSLSGIAAVARVVGWIVLVISSLMCLVGLARIMEAAGNRNSNPFDAMGGVGLLTGGGSLLSLSIILIIIGGVVQVLIDIEHNTSVSASAALTPSKLASSSPVHPRAAIVTQTSPATSGQDKPLTWGPTSSTSQTSDSRPPDRPEDFPGAQEVQDMIELAKSHGYQVDVRTDKITFKKEGGGESYCYTVPDVRRFVRLARLTAA